MADDDDVLFIMDNHAEVSLFQRRVGQNDTTKLLGVLQICLEKFTINMVYDHFPISAEIVNSFIPTEVWLID
ncbi:hypothetical protein ABEB36_003601 [Hypothenemus hampei]|uniref:Uncharacterized protein n=1 Tax=Hypothenemus hampei TaxID=57062 RepID=A0ABD1F9P7_HYPHA